MITFLIPTYKEFSNIELIVNKINNLYLKENYNIFFIDDDSNDGSLEKFKKLKNNYKNIYYHIRKSTSRDLTQSIIYALKFIDTEYIIVMDCDLQHDVNAVPIMIDALIYQNYNLVIGCRNINKINQLNRRYISFFGILLTKLTGIPKLKDPLSGFFGLKTLDFKNISSNIKSRGYKVLLSIIFYLSKDIKFKEIDINFYERQNEQSKLNLKVKIYFLLQIMKLIILRLIK
jgi:dolichol-phosphate mannosyltransferase